MAARLALVLVTATALCGCGASARPAPKLLALGTYLVGGESGFGATKLLRLDPRTLRPKEQLKLGDAFAGGAAGSSFVFSPDRRTLVFAGSNFGELLFVDPARLKLVRRLKVAKLRESVDADVEIAGWPRPDLVVAVKSLDGGWSAPHPAQLLLIDAAQGRVLRRIPVGGAIEGGVTTRDRSIVLLRTPATSGGVERGIPALVIVSPRGEVRVLPLPPLTLDGREHLRRDGTTFRAERTAALTTDGRRVFVVAAGRPIAEVDASTLRVRYHHVHVPDIRFSVPPIEPGSGGVHLRYSRSVGWLGRNLLAISGEDELPADVADPILGHRLDPIHVQLVDTRGWRVVRSLPATGCGSARELVLCSGGVRIQRGGADSVETGLVAYDREWHVSYRRPAPMYWSLAAGRLFVGSVSNVIVELDLRTGKRLRRVRPPDSWLPNDWAYWTPPR